MSRKVYTYEWLSPRSGYEFRLEFFDPGEFDKDFANQVVLPPGSIDLLTLDGYEYDLYPISTGKAPSAKLHIELKYLTASFFSDFVRMILNPTRFYGGNTFVNGDYPVSQSIETKAGTIIQFHIKANGTDAEDPAPWRLLKRFVHRNGIDDEDIWDIITDNVDFKIEDINKFVLDQVSFRYLENRYTLPYWKYTYRENLYDYMNKTSGYSYSLGQQADSRKQVFVLVPYRDPHSYVNDYAKALFCALIGDNTATYTVAFPEKKFYKQKYDFSGGIGAEVSPTDLYRVMSVRKIDKTNDAPPGEPSTDWQHYDEVVVGGLYTEKDENSLMNMYSSAWDYLSDWYEEHSCKAIYMQNGIAYSELWSTGGVFNVASFVITNKLYDAKASLRFTTITKTTSSLFEFVTDARSDASNFVEIATGNRNGIERTIPIFENNMPVNAPASRLQKPTPDEQSWTELKVPFMYHLQSKYHVHTIYYLDNPSTIIKTGSSAAIRVHERVDYVMKASTSGVVYNTPISTIDYSLAEYDPYETDRLLKLVEVIQDSGQCVHGVAAKKVMEAFGDYPEQYPPRPIEVELPFSDFTVLSDDMPFSFAGLDPRALAEINLTTSNPRVTTGTNDWIMISSTIDFMTETVRLKLINRKTI